MKTTQFMDHEPQTFLFSSAANRIIPFVLFFVGFWGYALSAVDYFNAVPGEVLDSRFNSVILEHVFRWFIGQETSLWNPRFFYPFERILYFSDNHFGSIMFYIPIRLLGFEREIAFDIWFLISVCLNFASTYFAFKLLRFSNVAASAGAFIFTFSLPVIQLDLHAQLFYRFQTPLGFVFFWRFLQRRDVADLSWSMFWTTWQFFSSIYLGVFLCYFLGAVLLAWFFSGKSRGILHDAVQSLRSHFRPKSIPYALLLFSLILSLGWMFYQYILVRNEYHLCFPQWQRIAFLPQFSAYFKPGDRLFFGYGIGLLLIIGVAVSFRKNAHTFLGRISFCGLLILVIVTGSIHGKSLYVFLQHIPGVSAIRAVGRIVLVMTLPVGILASVTVDSVSRLLNKKAYAVVFYLMLFSLLGTEMIIYTPANLPITVWLQRQHAVRVLLPEKVSADAILMVNVKEGEGHFETEVDGMLVAQDLGIATLNGYSGFKTPNFQPPLACSSPVNRLLAYADFRNIPEEKILTLADKLIVASPAPCGHEPSIGFFGKISSEMAKSIGIRIIRIAQTKKKASATVNITNHSQTPFRTLSLSGYPIRITWRFVPLATDNRLDEPPKLPDWTNRMETGWSLAANESRIINVPLQLPDRPADFLLEFSIVQDSVAFFHDLGMKIAQLPIGNAYNEDGKF